MSCGIGATEELIGPCKLAQPCVKRVTRHSQSIASAAALLFYIHTPRLRVASLYLHVCVCLFYNYICDVHLWDVARKRPRSIRDVCTGESAKIDGRVSFLRVGFE